MDFLGDDPFLFSNDFDTKLGTWVSSFGTLVTYSTLFRKAVFEGSLARFGYPFGSISVASGTFWVPFWYRRRPFGT